MAATYPTMLAFNDCLTIIPNFSYYLFKNMIKICNPFGIR